MTFASGMAAISAALGMTLRQGQEVLAHQILYGCTYSLMTNWLPRFGVQVRFADFLKPESLLGLVTPATRVLYFETPVNPTMELIDIAAIRRVADEVNAQREEADRLLVIVDNTFATPFCQRPLEAGRRHRGREPDERHRRVRHGDGRRGDRPGRAFTTT